MMSYAQIFLKRKHRYNPISQRFMLEKSPFMGLYQHETLIKKAPQSRGAFVVTKLSIDLFELNAKFVQLGWVHIKQILPNRKPIVVNFTICTTIDPGRQSIFSVFFVKNWIDSGRRYFAIVFSQNIGYHITGKFEFLFGIDVHQFGDNI